MPYARIARTLIVALILLAGGRLVQAQTPELGETTFPNSGAAEAQEPFLRGLLFLHSFEYEDAREAFQEARRLDPDFAMAAWGEAITHNHPVWFNQNQKAAQEALNQLAPTPEGRLAKAPTEREKDYLRVAEVLFFGDGDKDARDLAFAEAMRRLHEQYPDDLDAAAFYALSLLGTSHGGRDFRIYMQAAAVAEEVFARNPNHPGAAHYLIHSYDDPIHAPVGLRAARVYAKIAPAASHALHMPSHIFVAMGMWDDVVASNEDSWAAADARFERKNLGVNQRGFHALWWLCYGYLQQGRYGDALETLDIIDEDVRRSQGSGRTRFHLAAMRAAYLIGTEQWEGEAADIEVDLSGMRLGTAAIDLFATGMAASKSGDQARAEEALEAIQQRRASAEGTSGQDAAAVMEHELQALLFYEEGKTEKALQLMQEATVVEDAMRFDFGPPSPVKPSHELLGEMLLALDRAAEAQEQFRLALDRTPRRALALLGLARAAAKAGDPTTARHAYDTLRQIWHRADDDLTALQEVSGALSEIDAGSQ